MLPRIPLGSDKQTNTITTPVTVIGIAASRSWRDGDALGYLDPDGQACVIRRRTIRNETVNTNNAETSQSI